MSMKRRTVSRCAALRFICRSPNRQKQHTKKQSLTPPTLHPLADALRVAADDPVPRILAVVGFLVAAFIAVNVFLWHVAQKQAGPKPKGKKIGAKKAKRETLRRGLQLPSD